jgi:CRISPR-associated Csx11 family protein
VTSTNGRAKMEKLRAARPLLLACEAIGWLHMAGKANAAFLRGHAGQPNTYDYKQWFARENPPFPWSDRIAWVKDQFPLKGNAWPSSLERFVRNHTDLDPGLLGLLQAGHAMASGIEKQSYPDNTVRYLAQDATHLWLVSPFGHSRRNLLSNPPDVLKDGGWAALVDGIGKLLTELERLGTSASATCEHSVDDWWKWRESAIGEEGWLRRAFLSTLAETRLPNNDVTLWDQSYVAAALFKSAVAGVVLVGNSFNWDDVKQKTQWRVLTIGFGSDHYEARAVRIGDWVGARRDIERLFEKVRKLIEVDLAVGSLVYRDTIAMAFTFPGLRTDATDFDSNGSLDDNAAAALRVEIEQQIDEYAKAHKFETPPFCELSKSTRSFVGMIDELRTARNKLAVPIHRSWTIPCADNETRGHVCPVCRVRFNGESGGKRPNVTKQKPCAVCRERRRGRLDEWLKGGTETLWISEVADDNDRVALLTLSLGLEPWLDGTHVDTLRGQSIVEWRRHNPRLENVDNPISADTPHEALVRYVRSKLPSFDQNDPVLRSLNQGYRYENGWRSFFVKIVEDRSIAPSWDTLDKDRQDKDRQARWLVHQLLRKLPAPGRVHRFWRAAEDFFDELESRFRELAAAHPNRWRTRRLLIEAEDGGWQERETYLGHHNNAPFELLYENGRFLTICNLARVLRADDDGASLRRRPIEVKDDDGKLHDLTISTVRPADADLGVYHPLIVLDKSPLRFRVLVPLEAATACIEHAIGAWREEFARVFDRLPLSIGVVAFPRLTPFQAVIEATRNLEEVLSNGKCETWRVCSTEIREGIAALVFERQDRGRDLVLVPTLLPDGREDVFYPYVRVEDRQVRFPRDFQHPEGQVFRHLCDLRPGDGVRIDPSRVAAVFLDTTARRFERIEARPLSEFQRMRDIWMLLRRVVPSPTALRGAWAELEARKIEWRAPDGDWLPGAKEEWRELARAVLAQRLAVKGAALDALVEAAADGGLERALEWHLTWLKEGVEG